MEQDRIKNSQVLKKKNNQTPNPTFVITITSERNKTTEKTGFSKNTNSDSISLSRYKFNDVSLKFLSFQMSYISGGGKKTHFECKILTVYKNKGSIVKTF